jgi:hypothetical protein
MLAVAGGEIADTLSIWQMLSCFVDLTRTEAWKNDTAFHGPGSIGFGFVRNAGKTRTGRERTSSLHCGVGIVRPNSRMSAMREKMTSVSCSTKEIVKPARVRTVPES